MKKSVLAWHFTDSTKTLRYNDNRIIEAGKKLTVGGPIELCNKGLHASVRLIDALQYAPGPYIWRVKLTGEIIEGEDKCVATERTALWGFDASDVLRQFSRNVALEAIEKTWDASKFGVFPEFVKNWLKTGDESLRSAAESAARSAAESAARSAAWSAARSAAESAAWSTVRSAARSATWSATWSAAWSAARSAQSVELAKMIQAAKRKQASRK